MKLYLVGPKDEPDNAGEKYLREFLSDCSDDGLIDDTSVDELNQYRRVLADSPEDAIARSPRNCAILILDAKELLKVDLGNRVLEEYANHTIPERVAATMPWDWEVPGAYPWDEPEFETFDELLRLFDLDDIPSDARGQLESLLRSGWDAAAAGDLQGAIDRFEQADAYWGTIYESEDES